ncbi:Glycosyltransferase involved in cell wall bisynthesis [Rhizobium sp. RU33A]|nr:Glycosyltransferase involved in cell wall bisynthesis [Rhizobium sp. RU33A]
METAMYGGDEPLVSVVIPSYNHLQYLGRAIDSVLNQTYKNIECIVIDDGSTDGSYEYFLRLYGDNPRVHLSTRANQGAHNTINEGIAKARGDFINILNSDDTFAIDRLRLLVEAAGSHGDAFFAITDLMVVDENDMPFSGGPEGYYRKLSELVSNVPTGSAFWSGNIAMTTSNFFFSRQVWEETGPFRSLRYTHDWDWALRASERFGFKRLDQILLHYRVHGKNTISEPDIWSHIAENAVVFATSLRRMPLVRQQAHTSILPPRIMARMLKNDSFLPMATLYLLSLGRDDAELLSGLANGTLKQDLKDLLEEAQMTFDIMLSAQHLHQKVISSQAARGNSSTSGHSPENAIPTTRKKSWLQKLLPR